MNRKRRQKLILVTLLLSGIALAVALVLFALRSNINLFYTPSQVVAGEAPRGQTIRLGGMVEKNSVQRAKDKLAVSFKITDGKASVLIEYHGILPDLFREGQGIVTLGKINADNRFIASEVLAKHDENYMPPEVKNAMKRAE